MKKLSGSERSVTSALYTLKPTCLQLILLEENIFVVFDDPDVMKTVSVQELLWQRKKRKKDEEGKLFPQHFCFTPCMELLK